MKVKIYWLADKSIRLGVMPRPRGGDWLEDEIKSLRNSGVNILVSLLEMEEIRELELEREEVYCRDNDIGYVSFPIEDYAVPDSSKGTQEFAVKLSELVRAGKSIVIHCRQGIGRSSMLAALILGALGYSANDAFASIERARGRKVPDTEAQCSWVKNLFAEF